MADEVAVPEGAERPAAAPVTLEISPAQARANIVSKMKSTARLFTWIAGLSVVNTILYVSHANVTMLGGLGLTQVVDGVAHAFHQPSIGFGIDLMLACIYLALGQAAGRGSSTAFVVGMALYAMDALLLLWAQDFFNLAWHAYFLFGLYKGWQANGRLRIALARVEQLMAPG